MNIIEFFESFSSFVSHLLLLLLLVWLVFVYTREAIILLKKKSKRGSQPVNSAKTPIQSHTADATQKRIDISNTLLYANPQTAAPINENATYFVTTFDGEKLRLTSTQMSHFHQIDSELKAAYFAKNGAIKEQLSNYILSATSAFLSKYADIYNRESFLFLSTALLFSSPEIKDHYPISDAVRADILDYVSQMPIGKDTIYEDVYLHRAQVEYIYKVQTQYPSPSDRGWEKNYAKIMYAHACPRSLYSRQVRLATQKFLLSFHFYASTLLSQIQK